MLTINVGDLLAPNEEDGYCIRCNIWQPNSEFTKCTANPDGKSHVCKSCTRKYNQQPEVKARRQANQKRYQQRPGFKEKQAEYGLRSRLKHLDAYRARKRENMKRYRLKHPERALESTKKYLASEQGKQKSDETAQRKAAEKRWMRKVAVDLGII
jgi:hypothetical protein